jgi:hypothetical protein
MESVRLMGRNERCKIEREKAKEGREERKRKH